MIGERALRAILALVAAYHVVTGLIALVAPDTFFNQIGHYGLENSHYVGDVGAFMLAFGVAIGIAVVRPAWRAPLLWLGALWYGFHAINHAFDTGEAKSEARGWTDTLLIAFGAFASAWLARVSERLNGERAGGRGMRVFVAGASGAIGRPLMRQLVAAGHEVTGMTRSEERAEAMRAAGGNAVICDVYDAETLRESVAGARPEVVVHALTDLLPEIQPEGSITWHPTNRIRTEGTRNLIAAAQAAGARRSDRRERRLPLRAGGGLGQGRGARIDTEAPGHFGTAMRARSPTSRPRSLWADGIEGTVLRYGWFYGPGTHFDRDGSQAEEAHQSPPADSRQGRWDLLLRPRRGRRRARPSPRSTGPRPGSTTSVDDEPAPMREWVPVYAELRRRQEASPGAGLARAGRCRLGGGRQRDADAGGLKRQDQGKARLAAATPELAPGLPGSALQSAA